jgi:hypothetical protein
MLIFLYYTSIYVVLLTAICFLIDVTNGGDINVCKKKIKSEGELILLSKNQIQ